MTPKVWVSGFPSVNRNEISALAIMKKLKNDYFVDIDHTEKFQITDPPKVWVSGFPIVNRNGISVSAIMKKLKNGSPVYPTSHLCVVLHLLISFLLKPI